MGGEIASFGMEILCHGTTGTWAPHIPPECRTFQVEKKVACAEPTLAIRDSIPGIDCGQ